MQRADTEQQKDVGGQDDHSLWGSFTTDDFEKAMTLMNEVISETQQNQTITNLGRAASLYTLLLNDTEDKRGQNLTDKESIIKGFSEEDIERIQVALGAIKSYLNRQLIVIRYGLGESEPQNSTSVARRFNISIERAKQLERRGLKTLEEELFPKK
ncbi:MAG TPA: sigma factor-like helix-turn-helix DNA-binding protein [Verrucomicrobiae bacterium]|jgi:DNA-directed RNA polymerase sigma subunit (sigma70/sigma32)|nr:sigma factor-like helix-turn-helix DNA-binding protein [Verrucomicrobiae bacterium]